MKPTLAYVFFPHQIRCKVGKLIVCVQYFEIVLTFEYYHLFRSLFK